MVFSEMILDIKLLINENNCREFKGRKINFPEEKNTRPLRDFVRESIFNIIENSSKLKFQIKNSIVLDLFSGTGSFGLECISRGAKNVTFFENYPNTLKILKKISNY